jgi:spore coat protein A
MAITFSDLSDANNQFANIFDQSDVLIPPPRKRLFCEDGVLTGTLRLRSAWTRLHPMLRDTPVWAYDGMVPGPTVVVDSGDRVQIRVKNRITTKLPYCHVVVDSSASPNPGDMNQPGHQGEPVASKEPGDADEQRSAADLTACCVMHLHGAPTEPNSDGWAENVIVPGESAVHHYQFRRETFRTPADGDHPAFERHGGAAPMFWYHDHAMGATRFNNFAGLAGAWIVRDAIEDALGLPTDEQHELPLILQDRNLDTRDGSPEAELTGRLLHKVQTEVREFFGPATLVSGKLWPRINVEPYVYRLRLLNGSNARYFRLSFFGITSDGTIPGYTRIPASTIQQIGTDGGLLNQAIDLPVNGLVLAPGERADVLIDFGLIAEQYSQVVVFNDAPAPFGNDPLPAGSPDEGNLADLRPIPHVMRFDLCCGEPISGLLDAPIAGDEPRPPIRTAAS